MKDLTSGIAYERIKQFIYRVSVNGRDERGRDLAWTGTAFVVARMQKTGNLILATAKHVAHVPVGLPFKWTFEQFDDHGNTTRSIALTMAMTLDNTSLIRTYNKSDVGLIIVERLDQNGNERFSIDEPVPPVIGTNLAIATATRIAWAGFPGMVEERLGYPHLCYFEGVISAIVNRPDTLRYLIDGHGMQGTSGGPVWHWSSVRDKPEIVGIISEYQWPSEPAGMPGLCFFEPINPVLGFLHSWNRDVAAQRKE